jgi:hypothetical protein
LRPSRDGGYLAAFRQEATRIGRPFDFARAHAAPVIELGFEYRCAHPSFDLSFTTAKIKLDPVCNPMYFALQISERAMLDLHKALADIESIRSQVARGTQFRPQRLRSLVCWPSLQRASSRCGWRMRASKSLDTSSSGSGQQ